MATTFGELKRRVLLNLREKTDGGTLLAVEQAINDAHMVIAAVKDFDELMVFDTANAFTTASKKSYHVTTDLLLTRPKDIYSIKYMDGANSRKLIYVPYRELDEKVPYTELTGTGKPSWYTTRGMSIELYRIPDEAKPLYIMYSQWPAALVSDSDETPYTNIDHVIVSLATDIASGAASDWMARAQQLLGIALNEEAARPDRLYVAQPFRPVCIGSVGEYWLSPFVKRQPE